MTKISSSLQWWKRILIQCTSCKTSYNVLRQFVGTGGWGGGVGAVDLLVVGGGVVVQNRELGRIDWGKIDVIVILGRFSPVKQFHLKLTMNLTIMFTSLDWAKIQIQSANYYWRKCILWSSWSNWKRINRTLWYPSKSKLLNRLLKTNVICMEWNKESWIVFLLEFSSHQSCEPTQSKWAGSWQFCHL